MLNFVCRLALYQNLFFLLQTYPAYFSRIALLVRGAKLRKFIDHVLLSTFNYGNSNRDEYQLLKMFQAAIQEEMRQIDDFQEFYRGNPVFVRMALQYTR